MTGMEYGYGSPYVRIYYNGEEISPIVENFVYIADEENDDEIRISIESNDPKEADNPYWQEQAELEVVWGYIGGQTGQLRKVYVQEPTWKYSDKLITGTINCTEKARSLKYQNASEVYARTNLPALVGKVATKFDLAAFIEGYVPEAGDGTDLKFELEAKPGEYLDDYLKRNYLVERNGIVIRPVSKVPLNAKAWKMSEHVGEYHYVAPQETGYKNTKEWKDRLSKIDAIMAEAMQDKPPFLEKDIPQGNKTYAQMLNTEAMRTPGNWMMESRDDELILKRRNFNQVPYKAYEYRGEPGELINFTPTSRMKTRATQATKSGYKGWDGANKNFFGGQVSGIDTNSGAFQMFRKAIIFDRHLEAKNKGGLRIPSKKRSNQIFIGPSNVRAQIDNTGSYQVRAMDLSILTVRDRRKALEDSLKNIIDKYTNALYDPTANGVAMAYARAQNKRNAAELNMNPATATLVMDPLLMTGKVITIIGAGSKHSGNHYIIKATHTIKRGSSASTELEMVKTGSNKKLSPDDVPVRGPVNNTQGDTGPKEKTKTIKTKTNP